MKNTKTAARKCAPAKPRGNLKPGEIQPLIIAARKAFDYQDSLSLIDGEKFDDWRRREVMERVGKPGLTACHHGDFRDLLSHFQALAGDDGAAFANAMKSGKPTDHAAQGDDHEKRRQLAHTIAEILNAHIHLAETSRDRLLAEAVEEMRNYQPGLPWEQSTGPDAFLKLMERKAAIEAKKPLTVGYLVVLVRHKTQRKDLTLGQDWKAGLAERCTVFQLTQLRATIQNRVNAIEGLGTARTRNKSQSTPKAKESRAKKGSDLRW